jgi:LVIVD repeat
VQRSFTGCCQVVVNYTQMKKYFLYVIPFLLLVNSCTPTVDSVPGNIRAWVPVYGTSGNIYQVGFEGPRAIANAGKIYVFGNYLFQNEVNEGVHIINTTNRNSPVKMAFIKVPYSTEIAAKGNFLYVNNFDDLLVFDISNVNNILLVKRVKAVFPLTNQKFPPATGSFVCPDPSKGSIVEWKLETATNPECRR